MQKSLSRYWLLLGITALAVAGLFSLVLVMARTPSLANLPVFADIFHKALVVHVDLSVLVWFLCIACLLWSRQMAQERQALPLEEGALLCFALSMVLLTLSSLDPRGTALMSNYIPVITSPLFFLGLALLFCGVALMIGKAIVLSPVGKGDAISFGLFSAALIAVMSGAAFFWSYHHMPMMADKQEYFDTLFWGGGHVLQFTHTQIAMVCWLMLAGELHIFSPYKGRGLCALFSIGLLAALASPIGYLRYDVASSEHRLFFTHLMIAVNGIAPLLLAIMLLPGMWRTRGMRTALWSSLAMSLLLFLYGGALGGMIQGQNVVIPAHYHGSIVGVTLAFMGVAYLLLPEFGYRDASGWRMAYWQPIVYAVGQLMHISGLAYSGGYGILRKTPGGMENLPMDVKAAMGFMGLGGVIAIIGGLMFVVVMARAVWKSH